jgi:DNA modification methylase
MKPVEILEKLIGNSSKVNEFVYDCFCGSGSSMVACENLQRRCRAIEISPSYVSVALERMSIAFPALEIKRIA